MILTIPETIRKCCQVGAGLINEVIPCRERSAVKSVDDGVMIATARVGGRGDNVSNSLCQFLSVGCDGVSMATRVMVQQSVRYSCRCRWFYVCCARGIDGDAIDGVTVLSVVCVVGDVVLSVPH